MIRRPPFSIPGLFEFFYNFSYFGQYFCTTRLAMKGQGRTLFNQQCLKIVHKTSYLKTSLVKVQPWPFIAKQFAQNKRTKLRKKKEFKKYDDDRMDGHFF